VPASGDGIDNVRRAERKTQCVHTENGMATGLADSTHKKHPGENRVEKRKEPSVFNLEAVTAENATRKAKQW
jgi:hypothetical protein